MVRSTSTRYWSPTGSMPTVFATTQGWCSTSRKSADLRWLSRCSMPVERLAAAARISPRDFVGSASSRSSSPSTTSNLPRTVVTIMCLAEKRMSVWAGSIFQVLIASGLGQVVDDAIIPASSRLGKVGLSLGAALTSTIGGASLTAGPGAGGGGSFGPEEVEFGRGQEDSHHRQAPHCPGVPAAQDRSQRAEAVAARPL